MSVPVIAFFNNKGGVGKTSLVYHVAWMLGEQGLRALATDLDPQSNLSAAFLDEDRLETLWPTNRNPRTIYGAIKPLKTGVGDVTEPGLERISEKLALIAGDMALSEFEDELSQVWPKCLASDERAFRVTSAFWRVMQSGAKTHNAHVILVDLGPNLGAINRAAMVASDWVVIPLAPDLFSLQGLQNLGPTLREWRKAWKDRVARVPEGIPAAELPSGEMSPVGYVVMQHSVRRDRPVKSYDKWINRIPSAYRKFVLEETECQDTPTVADDPYCLAQLKHYRSLIPMAQEARKPVFALKAADGALGAHLYAVRDAHDDFQELARRILQESGVASSVTPSFG